MEISAFSVTQILREIDLWSSKMPFLAILGALNFVSLVNFSLQKMRCTNS